MANWYISSAGWTAVTAWAAGATIAVGNYRRQLAAPTFGNERVFKCTAITTGITGGAEPAWNLADGATTTDGGVTWTQVAGREAEQASANWKAPFANFQGWLNAINSANSNLYVSSDHAESSTAALTYNFPVPVQVVCVNRGVGSSVPPASTDVTTGASVTATVNQTVSWTASYTEGLTLIGGSGAGTGAPIVRPRGHTIVLSGCTIALGGTGGGQTQVGAGDFGKIVMASTSFSFAGTGGQITANGFCTWEWSSSVAVSGSFAPAIMFASGTSQNVVMRFRGIDFTNGTSGPGVTAVWPSTGSNAMTQQGPVEWEDCIMPAALIFTRLNAFSVTAGTDWRFNNCGVNTSLNNFAHLTDTGYSASKWSATAALSPPSRVGGATNAHGVGASLAFVKDGTGANSYLRPYRGPLFAYPITTSMIGVSKTVSFYLASMAALDNAQAWIVAEIMEGTGTLGTSKNTRAALQAAATGLSADTSDWTGSNNSASLTARANTTAYLIGQPIKLASNPGRAFICTTAGTSAGSEPAGYASAVDGGTVTDGTAVFQAVFRYVITLTYTPGKEHLLRVRPEFAPTAAATTIPQIYYDPQPTVT